MYAKNLAAEPKAFLLSCAVGDAGFAGFGYAD
jgi:hypothetical protein